MDVKGMIDRAANQQSSIANNPNQKMVINKYVNTERDDKPAIINKPLDVITSDSLLINENKDDKEGYEDYNMICDNCIIEELVGCNTCGINYYIKKHKSFDIKARRTVDNEFSAK